MTVQLIAASYGRTSKEVDDAYSVSSQLDFNREYAQRISAKLPQEYEFSEDYTGKALDRPAYTKIRDLVRNRKINILIVYATDRFARKVGVGDILLDELMQYGVQLHIASWGSYVRDVPEDRLRFNFEMTFSDFERGKIVERTTRGKLKKLREGFVIGCSRPPYGYRMIGTRKRAQLEIIEEQAEVVRDIYRMFALENIGTFLIARKMNARGVPSPGDLRAQDWGSETAGKLRYTPGWSANGIYEILNREAYSGLYPMQVHGETVHVAIPAIIDAELWEIVQVRLREGRQMSKRNSTHHNLMGRRVRCEACNRSMTVFYGKRGTYYKCTGKRQTDGLHCPCRYARADRIDAEAWEFVKELLLNPERLFHAWQEEQERRQQDNAAIYEDLARIERKVTENKAALARALDRLDALSDGVRDADERAYYEQKRDTIKQMLVDLREEYRVLQVKVANVGIPEDTIRSLAEIGAEYGELLERADLSFDFKRGLVDDLDVRGLVGADSDGRQYIDFTYCGKVKRRYLKGASNSNAENHQRNAAADSNSLGSVLSSQ